MQTKHPRNKQTRTRWNFPENMSLQPWKTKKLELCEKNISNLNSRRFSFKTSYQASWIPLLIQIKGGSPSAVTSGKKKAFFFPGSSWFCFCSNFFVFQSYELRFSEIFCPYLKRSFPGSFVFGTSLEGYTSLFLNTIFFHKCKKWRKYHYFKNMG